MSWHSLNSPCKHQNKSMCYVLYFQYKFHSSTVHPRKLLYAALTRRRTTNKNIRKNKGKKTWKLYLNSDFYLYTFSFYLFIAKRVKRLHHTSFQKRKELQQNWERITCRRTNKFVIFFLFSFLDECCFIVSHSGQFRC